MIEQGGSRNSNDYEKHCYMAEDPNALLEFDMAISAEITDQVRRSETTIENGSLVCFLIPIDGNLAETVMLFDHHAERFGLHKTNAGHERQ